MDEQFLGLAADITHEGHVLTLDALARKAGVSRSTAHRRTGGLSALLEALETRGVDSQKQTTRGRLIASTRSLVATQGIVGVTVERIAEHASVSPVSVYRTFGDRETLLQEAFKDVFPDNVLAEIELETLPLEDALFLIAQEVVRFAGTYPGLMALILLPASSERAELMSVHNIQRDLRARVIFLFESYVTAKKMPPCDVESRAASFLGLCLGASLIMHEIRPLDEKSVKPRARQVVRRFLNTMHDSYPDSTKDKEVEK